jgi:hypothetical protein
VPRKRKLSQSPFARKARACRQKHKRSAAAFWRCVNKGKKVKGKGGCAHGRVLRGPRKGRCRDRAPAWAARVRRQAYRDD